MYVIDRIADPTCQSRHYTPQQQPASNVVKNEDPYFILLLSKAALSYHLSLNTWKLLNILCYLLGDHFLFLSEGEGE
ncbi:hypothetical protein Ahy_B05g079472 isoform D [Arachis hypogaea]|uniref:Uncharacterized protein n=1 Tax=Arachis hypogaea TaxID=3818 RepID=A0A444Z9X4_ARAHY|nr:hypothetical protein Ahy_B05g079472 isoform D [Arachis hypogaea]